MLNFETTALINTIKRNRVATIIVLICVVIFGTYYLGISDFIILFFFVGVGIILIKLVEKKAKKEVKKENEEQLTTTVSDTKSSMISKLLVYLLVVIILIIFGIGAFEQGKVCAGKRCDWIESYYLMAVGLFNIITISLAVLGYSLLKKKKISPKGDQFLNKVREDNSSKISSKQ